MTRADGTLGLCSIAALDHPLDDLVAAAADAGLDGLEVTARPPHLSPDDPGAASRARASVEARELEVVAYGAYYGVPDRRTEAHAEQDVAIAVELGAPRIRVWANAPPVDAGRVEPVATAMQAICDRAGDAGIDVVAERHIGSWADSAERIDVLLAAVDRPNFALNYQSLDLLPEAEIADQPADAARLAGRSRYMHVKNYRPPDEPGGRVQFGAGLEAGVLDYERILDAVAAAGFDAPISIEFLAFDERGLAERVADDAAFLRRTWSAARARAAGA